MESVERDLKDESGAIVLSLPRLQLSGSESEGGLCRTSQERGLKLDDGWRELAEYIRSKDFELAFRSKRPVSLWAMTLRGCGMDVTPNMTAVDGRNASDL
jgi:hypothetical protein